MQVDLFNQLVIPKVEPPADYNGKFIYNFEHWSLVDGLKDRSIKGVFERLEHYEKRLLRRNTNLSNPISESHLSITYYCIVSFVGALFNFTPNIVPNASEEAQMNAKYFVSKNKHKAQELSKQKTVLECANNFEASFKELMQSRSLENIQECFYLGLILHTKLTPFI